MLAFILFLSLLMPIDLLCGNTFGCVKKQRVTATPDGHHLILGDESRKAAISIVASALVMFDEKKDVGLFNDATGLVASVSGDGVLSYEVRTGNILIYEAGSPESKKKEFMDNLGRIALLTIFRSNVPESKD